MRVNLQIPHWVRANPKAAPRTPNGRFFLRLSDYLGRRSDLCFTVSQGPIKAHELGRHAFAINHHTTLRRRRNLNAKIGYVPSYFYADAYGYSGWSRIAESQFDPDAIDATLARHYYAGRVTQGILSLRQTKHAQPRGKPALPSEYVFVPLQVPRDSVMSLARITQEQLIDTLCSMASEIPVVFKVHPQSRAFANEHSKLVDALHAPLKGIHVVDANIYDLIPKARAVVTINSGVGFEALVQGAPVITCGGSDYEHITSRAATAADLPKLIAEARRPSQDLIEKYAYWYLGQQMIDLYRPVQEWGPVVLRRLAGDAGGLG